MWWTALALSDIHGYREHVALIFETIALAIVMIIYIASVLAIFIHEAIKGDNIDQV